MYIYIHIWFLCTVQPYLGSEVFNFHYDLAISLYSVHLLSFREAFSDYLICFYGVLCMHLLKPVFTDCSVPLQENKDSFISHCTFIYLHPNRSSAGVGEINDLEIFCQLYKANTNLAIKVEMFISPKLC